ncbi:MAG: TonB-dependent receptor, partial [Acidobacteriota bacterium]
MRRRVLCLLIALALLTSSVTLAQGNPTGRITGTVTHNGATIPGVSITAESPNLQQPRQVATQSNGSFLVGALPPGDYRLTFELEGLETVIRNVNVSVAQLRPLDVEMSVTTVSEEIVVTGESGAISETNTTANTLSQDFVEQLAVQRNLRSAVALSPGTSTTGPGNNITISGAQSFENLYLINGVPVNENLRGQPADLFIEDAIEETTVSTAGISAEYGRFTGGVVNAVTKSGGNDFSGSLRTNFTNDDWTSQTPFGEELEDELSETFEATLGGFLLKDRIWFFVAGRSLENETLGETTVTNLSFPQGQEETRVEGKLTFSLGASHQVLVSAVDLKDDRIGNVQGNGALDLGAVNNNVAFPEESFGANYTGILTNNFFVEAQISERSLEFEGIGGTNNDLLSGTPFLDSSRGALQYHQPIFCGNCPNNDFRETESAIVKGSYFLTTESAGSHDIVFGVDTYNDIRSGDNTQSATDFEVWSTSTIIRGNEVFPQLFPFQGSFIITRPVLASSLGTDFRSNSAYVNDNWQLGDHWSFNLGLRYDENDGVDSAGNAVAEDSAFSPRLGVSYDVKGDGDLVLRASAGRYVTRIANSVGNSTSAAGNPAFFGWFYGGDPINPDPNAANLISADDALELIFAWFDSVGGVDNDTFVLGQNIPGSTNQIDGSLDSPNADELTLGFSKRLGSRGLLRADVVHRDFGDFYFQRTDTTTGTVLDGNGDPADLTLVQNDDSILERKYDALQTSFQYRLTDSINIGGNWTWSHARGNFAGETTRSGPVSGAVGNYPEYRAFAQNNPRR